MAASLAKFGDPIGDRQMVLTLLRGLSGKFRHMVSILKMNRPFPTFAEARTHLLMEELEIDARPLSPPATLVAAAPRPAVPGAPATRPNAPTGGQRNSRRRGRNGRGGHSTNTGGAPLHLTLVRHMVGREPLHQACTRRSPIPGPAPCACGRMTHPGAQHHHLRSTPYHTMVASVALPAPTTAPTTAPTGELHHQCSRCPRRRIQRRRGIPLTVGPGTRTP
jgi:hypothetical protein